VKRLVKCRPDTDEIAKRWVNDRCSDRDAICGRIEEVD